MPSQRWWKAAALNWCSEALNSSCSFFGRPKLKKINDFCIAGKFDIRLLVASYGGGGAVTVSLRKTNLLSISTFGTFLCFTKQS